MVVVVTGTARKQPRVGRRTRATIRQKRCQLSLTYYTWFVFASIGWCLLFGIDIRSFYLEKLGGVVSRSPHSLLVVQKCKYDGNCPVGSTCLQGDCVSYLGDHVAPKESSPVFRACIQSCLSELTNDEYYYHGSVPTVERTHNTTFGSGCAIQYKRQKKIAKTGDPPMPSLEVWIQSRLRRVVRVDPNPTSYPRNGGDDHNRTFPSPTYWIALCRDPCEGGADCNRREGYRCMGRTTPEDATSSSKDAFKSCHIPSRADTDSDMVIVSGASAAYFAGLKNFAASLYYWAPNRKLVVYNLGLSEEQLEGVRKWPNLLELEWPHGIPSSYPDHVRNDLKNYAWKSLVVNETVHRYKSIFWLDGGATFTGPIDEIEEIIHRNGIFLVKGQDDHMQWKSHPSTYRWFGYDKDSFESGPHWAGGIQGHVYPSRYIETIVKPNAECALDPACIAPPGSDLLSHRYDQTSLSILGYQYHVRPPHHTELLAAGRDQLPANLSESNRMVLWTSRGACTYYSDLFGW